MPLDFPPVIGHTCFMTTLFKDVPHYKASMPLQKKYITNADGTGIMLFTQIRRTNNVALYERKTDEGRVFSYELIIVKTTKAGTVYAKGTKPTEKDSESYPGAASFGKLAWELHDLDTANKRFDLLVASEKQKKDEKTDAPAGKAKPGRKSKKQITVQIPVGEFTMKMLIAETGLTQPVLHPIVKTWLKESKIKVIGQIKAEGRGRPSLRYQIAS